MSRFSRVLRHSAKKRLLQARLIHQCAAPSCLMSSNRSPPRCRLPSRTPFSCTELETRHSARDHVTPKSLKKKIRAEGSALATPLNQKLVHASRFHSSPGKGYKIENFVASVLVQNFTRYITTFVVTDLPLFFSWDSADVVTWIRELQVAGDSSSTYNTDRIIKYV